ncbi:hypothetical protein [Aliivibrio fischeri]|uniref:hypothetical protein n=1 Tax=Aliivibrio fischeri TaxID=668 RepID=UPI00031F5947|nr:hypothetical protein [Aliivibrio fischeri]OEE09042.1 hypothetical protein A1Q3_11970 [Aliivibrio fischeri ZF-211]
MSFFNKHIYIIPEVDRFFYLHVDALINKAGIAPESFCAIFITDDKNKTVNGYPGVEYINSQLIDFNELQSAKTITSLSLNSFNSAFIAELINFNESVVDKFYIFITDDEVDRWDRIYQEFGSLKARPNLHISNDDLFVLSKAYKFIGLEIIFKNTIERVLGRQVEFINSGCIFDILLCKDHNHIKNNIIFDKNKKEKRIWFHTKNIIGGSNDIKKLVDAYISFAKAFDNNIHFVVFVNNIKTFLYINIAILYLKKVKKLPVKIDILNHTDQYSYMQQLATCDFLILQPRGGASTARSLIKIGRGMVCTLEGTKNNFGFEKGYKVPVIKGDSYLSLAQQAKDEKFDITASALILAKKEQESLSRYKELYK